MNDLTITVYQQDIVWTAPEANRRAVEKSVVGISDTDIFVVPETFTTGFGDHMAALAEVQEGPTLQWARRIAALHDMLFVGTWIVMDGDSIYNRLHWVYPNGDFGYYDKGHTFRVSGEADQIARGTERKVFEYKGWRIKPAVCYDLRFPKWLRNNVVCGMRNEELPECGSDNSSSLIPHSSLDYDLLLLCANWPGSRHEAWTTLLKARAIENQCYVIGCNRAGIDGANIPYTGNSTIIDYKGFPLAEAESVPVGKSVADGLPVGKDLPVGKEQIITATLHKEPLDRFRDHWPFYLDFD